MYRVLLADDEKWVLYGLKKLIDWEACGFTVADTASNGAEALLKVKEMELDLLICDIRMPNMSGLKLIEEIRHFSNIEVIFITGYDDFKYAQQAIRLGVFDYIMKQVEQEELIDSLKKVKVRLDTKKIDADWNVFLNIFDEENRLSALEVAKKIGIMTKYPCCKFLIFEYNKPFQNDKFNILKCITTQEYDAVLFRIGLPYIGVLLFNEQNSSPNIQQYSDQIFSKSMKLIGSGETVDGHSLFYQLYQNAAVSAATYYYQGKDKLFPYSPRAMEDVIPMIKRIDDLKESSEQETIVRIFTDIIQEAGNLQMDAAIELYNYMIVWLTRRYPQKSGYLEARYLNHYLGSMIEYRMFFEIIIKFLNELPIKQTSHRYITDIMEYINDHYTEEIRLRDLAQIFYLSENYISFYIKQEVNKTFTELIIEKRITLARKLLCETSMTIGEIAEAVGYSEYSYFSKLFKKCTGFTLTDYRKNHGS